MGAKTPTLVELAHQIGKRPYRHDARCLQAMVNKDLKAELWRWLVVRQVPIQGYWRSFFEIQGMLSITNQVHSFLMKWANQEQYSQADVYVR